MIIRYLFICIVLVFSCSANVIGTPYDKLSKFMDGMESVTEVKASVSGEFTAASSGKNIFVWDKKGHLFFNYVDKHPIVSFDISSDDKWIAVQNTENSNG